MFDVSAPGLLGTCIDTGASVPLKDREQAEAYYDTMGIQLIFEPRPYRTFKFGDRRKLVIPHAKTKVIELFLEMVDLFFTSTSRA